MPGCPKENRNELEEAGSSGRLSHAQSSGDPEKRENSQWDSELGCRRPFTGVRSKSANAVLFTSPLCEPVKDEVTLQTETQEKDTVNQAEEKQKLSIETAVDEGFETENIPNTTDVKVKKAAEGGNLDKDPHCVPVNTDTVPYLSIGTNQNKPDDVDKQSAEGAIQRVVGRISSWPPTAVQWQARCKMMEKEAEGSEVFTVWTAKLPGEVKRVSYKREHHLGEDEMQKNQIKDPLKVNVAQMKVGHSRPLKPTNDKTTPLKKARAQTDMKQEEQLKKEEMIQDPATVRQTISETQTPNPKTLVQTRDMRAAEKSASVSTNKSEPNRSVTSRQRAGHRSTGSKAPSGGASPDDETLLSGNEYAFMDLLHEVVQNNGRWTRERWRQTHANKQRR